jgi:hypothetical protein
MSLTQQILPLENRAWKGTRLCLGNEIASKYPFNFEVMFHMGRKAYMIEIYHYNPKDPTYNNRLSRSISNYTQNFFATINLCLDFFEQTIFEKYNLRIKLERDPNVLILNPY